MKAEGIDVCGFGAGEPDFDTPEHIKAAAMASLDGGFTKYTPSSGTPELRQAIAEKFKADNGLDYKPSQIVVSNGAKHSCYNAILATCQPGDEVIIPAPYWLSYPEMVRLAGAEPVFVQTKEENGWKMTAEEFQDAMTPRTKMVIINSPGNPTGSVYTREELEALVEVADRRGDPHPLRRDLRKAHLRWREARQRRLPLPGSLQPDDHDQRLLESLRDDRLASRLSGRSRADRQGDRRHPEPQHLEPLLLCPDRRARGTQGRPGAWSRTCARSSTCAASTCSSRLKSIPRVTVVNPKGAFYVLANISQLGLNSTNFAERLL